jgi:hypothetical protein
MPRRRRTRTGSAAATRVVSSPRTPRTTPREGTHTLRRCRHRPCARRGEEEEGGGRGGDRRRPPCELSRHRRPWPRGPQRVAWRELRWTRRRRRRGVQPRSVPLTDLICASVAGRREQQAANSSPNSSSSTTTKVSSAAFARSLSAGARAALFAGGSLSSSTSLSAADGYGQRVGGGGRRTRRCRDERPRRTAGAGSRRRRVREVAVGERVHGERGADPDAVEKKARDLSTRRKKV